MCALGQCTIDADCSALAPYCSPTMTCIGCRTDADCDASAPVCDSSTSTCRGCDDDSECDSQVCDARAGTCIDSIGVLYVSSNGGGNSCSQSAPCDLATALNEATNARQTIKLAQGYYFGAYTLPAQPFNIHGSDSILTSNMAGTAALSLADNGSLKISRLTVQGFQEPNNAGAAIQCFAEQAFSPGNVELDQVTAQTAGIAIWAHQCHLSITRSHVSGAVGVLAQSTDGVTIDRTLIEQGTYVGLISASAATVHVTNSVFSSTNTGGFIFSTDHAATTLIDVSFSTIVGAPWTCMTPSTCDGAAPAGVCISDSIVMSMTSGTIDTLDATCGIDHSIVYPQTAALNGSNNLLVDPTLADPANGDFHLMSGSPAVDAADPSASDSVDFDGVSRPQGATNDIGAYELVQP